MMALPTGTVTFLFTDIEGSTRLLHALGERYRTVQDRHGEIVRAAVDAKDGHLVRTVGDSFFVTFRARSMPFGPRLLRSATSAETIGPRV